MTLVLSLNDPVKFQSNSAATVSPVPTIRKKSRFTVITVTNFLPADPIRIPEPKPIKTPELELKLELAELSRQFDAIPDVMTTRPAGMNQNDRIPNADDHRESDNRQNGEEKEEKAAQNHNSHYEDEENMLTKDDQLFLALLNQNSRFGAEALPVGRRSSLTGAKHEPAHHPHPHKNGLLVSKRSVTQKSQKKCLRFNRSFPDADNNNNRCKTNNNNNTVHTDKRRHEKLVIEIIETPLDDPDVSPNHTSKLKKEIARRWALADAHSQQRQQQPVKYWMIDFTQPIVNLSRFNQRLHDHKIALESVHVRTDTGLIFGRVSVANVCFEKTVFIRLTRDNWESHVDWSTQFARSVDPITDSFEFRIPIGQNTDVGRLEFCACFVPSSHDDNIVYWDNNNGCNYAIVHRPLQRQNTNLDSIDYTELNGAKTDDDNQEEEDDPYY